MSPSLQLADALVTACAQTLRQRGRTTCSARSTGTATGGPILRPTPRSNPISFCWSCGGIRRRTACGIRPREPLIDKAVRSILARQLPDGGFNIYAHGPSEISATIKAYTALKLAGLPYDDPQSDPRARAHPGAGRLAGGQQLRQGQSQPVRSVSARTHALDSARIHAARESDLRNVVVDARHRDSAFDRACDESAASGAGGIHAERTARARRAVRVSRTTKAS